MADIGKVKRARRSRVNYTQAQLSELEAIFQKSQYPDALLLESLSEKTDIPVHNLCTWFQNRRSKFRRDSKKCHIDWMRNQLYEASQDHKHGHSPGGASNSEHVLSTKTSAHTGHLEKKPTAIINYPPLDVTKISPHSSNGRVAMMMTSPHNQTTVPGYTPQDYSPCYTSPSVSYRISADQYDRVSTPYRHAPVHSDGDSPFYQTSHNTSDYYSSPEQSPPSYVHQTINHSSPETYTPYTALGSANTCYYNLNSVPTPNSGHYDSRASDGFTVSHQTTPPPNYTSPLSWLLN